MDFTGKNGLFLLMILFIGTTAIVNAFLFSNKITGSVKYKRLPSPFIIACVWTVLIGFMAYSQWLVLQKTTKGSWKRWLIPLLFIFCVLYPFYTMGFQNKKMIFLANIITILLSLSVALSIYTITRIGSFMIFMTTLWSSFATYASL